MCPRKLRTDVAAPLDENPEPECRLQSTGRFTSTRLNGRHGVCADRTLPDSQRLRHLLSHDPQACLEKRYVTKLKKENSCRTSDTRTLEKK